MTALQAKETVYLECWSGSVRVTDRYFRSPRNTYRFPLARISVSRMPFFFALILAGGSALFGWAFEDLLYPNEQLILWVGSALIVLISWCIGMLHVKSLAVSEFGLIGPIWTVRRVREALDRAMNHNEGSRREAERRPFPPGEPG